MDETRRRILERIDEGPVPGPALAEEFDVSRAAIWKHVEALRDVGFEIAVADEGYVIREVPSYGEEAVTLGLDAPYDVVYRDSVQSTNDLARALAEEDRTDLIVLADEQPTGRGRLGRDWVGPPGGIYLSILLRPALSPMAVPMLTLAAAVATVEAIADEGAEATIKWPNDVLHEGRKLAGILTEMEGEADRVNWVVVGVGLNANVDSAELPPEATSLREMLDRRVNRRRIVQRLVRSFQGYREAPASVLPAWRSHSETIGERVRIETATETIVGTAVDIVHPGSLLVETDHGRVRVHAGDCEHLHRDG